MSVFFAGVSPVRFEGPQSTNPFAYRYYNKNEQVLGKAMAQHLRPALQPATPDRQWPATPDQSSPVLRIRSARFEVRLATTRAEKHAAQHLCYTSFFTDRALIAPEHFVKAGRVFDPLDAKADYLIVIDRLAGRGGEGPKVVGTYRAIRHDSNFGAEQFCAAASFDLGAIVERYPSNLCEISRSCVDARYRRRRVVEMLWAGLWVYAQYHKIDAYFGAASLPGADPVAHVPVLAWLLNPDPKNRPGRHQTRTLRRSLPPLLRAYLDAGASISGPPRPDPVFDTTDLLAAIDLKNLPPRYVSHFGTPGPKTPGSPPCERPPR